MNWPYVHTLINHFPIILMVVGTGVLLLALIVRRRGLWLYALATLTLAGLSIYPAFFTGDQAADAVRNTWYIVRSMVEEHDAAAGYALVSVLLAGAVSAYTWWRMLRREVTTLPPVWLRVVVAVIAVWALSVVARTAYLGGQIVHDSPKLVTPAAMIAPVPSVPNDRR
ncbi:MAG TPA: hypothetical protein VJW73_07585 [Gemmatimonadaceae bacterium]|nr:hypothetical protein [Gemmatimonadaceae bacterium]